MNNLQNNVVTLAGEIVSGAVFSHETYGEKFYEITLAVKRLARDIMPFDDTINPNTLKLNGYICKPPVYRKTPFNREICDVLIAVNRQYGKSDYIPCIVWGRNARFAQNLSVGEHICVSGRVQSRTYQKKLSEENVVTRTAYEVSVNKIDVVDDSILPTPADTVV